MVLFCLTKAKGIFLKMQVASKILYPNFLNTSHTNAFLTRLLHSGDSLSNEYLAQEQPGGS